MRTRSIVVLLAVAVLVSLGTATQMADAYSTNGRIVGVGANEVDGTFYHKADNRGVYFQVIFDGDRTASGSSDWDAAVRVGQRPANSKIGLTNTNTNSEIQGFQHIRTNPAFFYFEYKAQRLDDGATTVTFPAGSVGPAGDASNRNAELTYSFVYDTIAPVVSGDFSTVLFEIGDLVHRGNLLVIAACDDINRESGITIGTGPNVDTSRIGDYVYSYTCEDKAGNSATATKTYRVIEPINISIASDNVYDTSKAKYNDKIIITFDLATNATFTGSVTNDGGSHELAFASVNNTGTLTKSLNGNEGNGQVSFSLTITHSDGGSRTYTAVQGTGVDTLVTTDFIRPTLPDNISIAHNGAGGATANAQIGDIVTVTFDTSADATETTGTIGGRDAEYTISGTTGKLTITLDGTESSEVQPLPFSFRIIDHAGNADDIHHIAVKGDGRGTSVTTDTTAPEPPAFYLPKPLFNTTPISLSGTAEADSTVELFKDGTSVGSVSVGSGFFRFTGVELTEGFNYFTIAATDASSNTSLASGTTIIILDTAAPAVPTNISIESDNARDTSLAKLDDTVTITFGTDEGSTVTGTIDGKSAEFVYAGASSTLTRTLNGTETENAPLTFEFTQTDLAGNDAATQTAVRGSGSSSSVTADFRAPAASANISIESDNTDPTRAKLDDTVTVTFDTEEGSTVAGTINGKNAKPDVTGTVGTLELTLDGTETEGASLAFKFTQTDAAGNIGVTQTAVRGSGAGDSVTVDFRAPAVPTYIYITHDGDYPNARLGDNVTVTFDTEEGSAVTGTIDGENAKFDSDDFNGFLVLTLSGDETEGAPLTFSFVQSNSHGSTVAQTAVRGFGDTTSVTADFVAPAVPTDISIASNNTDTSLAKLGDIVTITFGTDEGSTVTGTIDGKSAEFVYAGASSTLTRTLDGTETEDASLTFEFTQTDLAGNDAATQTAVRGSGSSSSVTADFVAPDVPDNISIESDNTDPTRAKLDDTVTVTFDTEEGSTVAGTINGKNAKPDVTGTVGTLELTLDGTETEGASLAFEFTQTDAAGNIGVTQTAVRGSGAGDSVTVDFRAPAVPTDISIESDNTDLTLAKLGDIVTITFDTEEGSAVTGTIDGKSAEFVYAGASSTLTRTLNGTETEGLLTFSFVQSNSHGSTVAQTAVKGFGNTTSVTADFTAPAIPTNISIESDNADPTRAKLDDTVTVTFDIEEGPTAVVEGMIDGAFASFYVIDTVGILEIIIVGSETESAPLTFNFNQTDAAGNIGVIQTAVRGSGIGSSVTADFEAPAVPTHIYITHNGAGTNAVSGDTVTVSFDTEEGSAVTGTIDGEDAKFALSGTTGTLELTLRGYETQGSPLAFSFVQTDAAGNAAATQTAVRGLGAGNSVTIDPVTPAVPTNISIASDNADPTLAKLGDIVTVTFDTVKGSAVTGTIDGEDAKFALSGTTGTLKLTLSGDETPDVPLEFSFVQTNDNGSTVAQTAVRGSGSTTSVTADFTAPAIPVFTNSTATVSTTSVTLVGTADDGSTVTLYKGETVVDTATATGGTFEFARVALTGGSNSFTITATDASSNVSAKSAALVITHPPLITSPTSGTFSTHKAITIRGTGEPGIKIAVCHTAACSGAITIGDDGRWTLEDFSLANGENVFKLFYILADGFTKDPDGLLVSPTVTITYERPTFTDLIANNIKSSLNPNTDQIIYHYITTPSNVVSLYGTSAPNIKLDLMHITGYDPDPRAAKTFTSFAVIDTFVSSSDGIWQSSDFALNEGSNIFYLRGHDNPKYRSGNVAIVTYDPAVDEITVGGKGYHTPELIPKDSASPIKLIPEPQSQKKSSGSNDWHKKPTFGISHLTYKQIVDNGFSFNGYSLTVTDNWHTDFHLTSSLIGETNTVKIKTYSADPLKWINLYLGVPRLGDVSDAESEIQLIVSRDYNNPVDYTIDEINHYQAEGLVNVDDTTASLQKIKCQASDKDEKCYEFTINFTVMAPLHEEVVAISAMDDKRRQHVTYINEGVEFTGESLLDARTAQLMQKKTNQGQAEIIELTQQDRRYNVWEDQHGYLWTLNEYGTWTQITVAEFKRHQDSTGNVMTRQNSNFASLIEQERQKALLVFDSSDLISELDDYFAYDYSNVDSDMSKLEKYAYELQLESERAQKYSSNPD